MILEMRATSHRVLSVLRKVWFRLREFVLIAWPILIAGSVISASWNISISLRVSTDPLFFTSGLLGLPSAVGITLIFGILRKELAIIMLVQALGTTNFSSVMKRNK